MKKSPSKPAIRLLLALVATLAFATASSAAETSPTPRVRASKTCEPTEVMSLFDQMAALCPCDNSWQSHRFYKACLRRAQRTIMKYSGNTLRRSCIKVAFRCGALSTCAESQAKVTCSFPTGGKCVSGVCGSDPAQACTSNEDCASSCTTADSRADCEGDGGTAGTGACCSFDPLP